VVSGDAGVAGEEGDQLGAEAAAGVRRHGGEEPAFGDGEHQPHRLHGPAGGEVAQRLRHRGNERIHPQQAPDGGLVEDGDHWLTSAAELARRLLRRLDGLH
jgi:hypothetical protein